MLFSLFAIPVRIAPKLNYVLQMSSEQETVQIKHDFLFPQLNYHVQQAPFPLQKRSCREHCLEESIQGMRIVVANYYNMHLVILNNICHLANKELCAKETSRLLSHLHPFSYATSNKVRYSR